MPDHYVESSQSLNEFCVSSMSATKLLSYACFFPIIYMYTLSARAHKNHRKFLCRHTGTHNLQRLQALTLPNTNIKSRNLPSAQHHSIEASNNMGNIRQWICHHCENRQDVIWAHEGDFCENCKHWKCKECATAWRHKWWYKTRTYGPVYGRAARAMTDK